MKKGLTLDTMTVKGTQVVDFVQEECIFVLPATMLWHIIIGSFLCRPSVHPSQILSGQLLRYYWCNFI